jgi:hypothetical protein
MTMPIFFINPHRLSVYAKTANSVLKPCSVRLGTIPPPCAFGSSSLYETGMLAAERASRFPAAQAFSSMRKFWPSLGFLDTVVMIAG